MTCHLSHNTCHVMAGLVPAIHDLSFYARKSWSAGTRAFMPVFDGYAAHDECESYAERASAPSIMPTALSMP